MKFILALSVFVLWVSLLNTDRATAFQAAGVILFTLITVQWVRLPRKG